MVLTVTRVEITGNIYAIKMIIFQLKAHHWPINMGKHMSVKRGLTHWQQHVCKYDSFFENTCANSCVNTWRFIPASKWVLTRVISELTLLSPVITRLYITYVLGCTSKSRQLFHKCRQLIYKQFLARDRVPTGTEAVAVARPNSYLLRCWDYNVPIIDLGKL